MAKPSIEQMEELFAQVRDGRITQENLQRFIRDPNAPSGNIYTLDVDYGLTFDQQVAAGKYDWKNPDVQPNRWLIEGTGTRQFQAELLHLPNPKRGYNSTDEVLTEAKRRGLIRPSPEHILAFGRQHPLVQKEFPVVGLFEEKKCWRDSVDRLNVLSLDFYGDERELLIRWLGRNWCEHCRFLFLRNIV